MEPHQGIVEFTAAGLQKLFLLVTGLNFSISWLAYLESVPLIAPAISLCFAIPIGILTIIGLFRSNNLKRLQIEKELQQRQINEAQG